MSAGALLDLLAALALVLVVEGIALAFASRRIAELLEALRLVDPDRVRWGGLVMAVAGTLGYVLLRG